ncbi:Uu.00g017270.m01.CDS01 [Anthostomella pinea]|uniref:Uu.00g017270.m01.CDS01 n=1 Tax=Anthostomella pinea TaxID=933095 RepID=A0AAI8YQI5_9PEZI|nr:Uu.00g017270.m01.CDS01 [Anthostomella pinea]
MRLRPLSRAFKSKPRPEVQVPASAEGFPGTRCPAYPYQALPDTHIRLLQILPGEYHDQIECRLDCVPLSPEPYYYALSYVWGDASRTLPLSLEGIQFEVTINLYAALHQLRQLDDGEYPYTESYFWIDAICLNQNDLAEKSQHVPRMNEIYSESIRVVIWLAYNGPSANNFRKRLSRKAKSIWYSDVSPRRLLSSGVADILLLGHGSRYVRPSPDVAIEQLFATAERFWSQWLYGDEDEDVVALKKEVGRHYALVERGLLFLMQTPWFQRTWTVQEACLGGLEPVVYVGKHSIELDRLYQFLIAMARQHRHVALAPGMMRLAGLNQIRNLFRGQFHKFDSIECPMVKWAECLMMVRGAAGTKESTNPLDQLYGFLGIVTVITRQSMPPELMPDYSLPYGEVCWRYSVFILEHTADLGLLGCTQNQLVDVPSWVPDFRYAETVRKSQKRRGIIQLSPDKTALHIWGLEVQPISDHLDGCPWKEIQPDTASHAAALSRRLKEIEERIIRRSSTLRKIPQDDVLDSWVKDHHRGLQGDLKSFRQTYRQLSNGTPITLTKGSRTGNAHAREITMAHEFSRACLLLTDGTIVCVDREDIRIQPGDLVCLFKGLATPSLIRPSGEAFAFLSQCRIRSGTFDGLDIDDEFWAGRDVKEYRLV